MTDSPQQPYFPAQYPQAPGTPGYYAPRPAYEGLTKRQKRAAAWAGAIGLNIMSFGGTVLVAIALLALLAVTFAGVSSSADPTSGLRGFAAFLTDSQVPVLLGVAAAVGVVVLLLGMFLSAAILRAGRVRRPFAVTWSAFGITVPILTVLNFIGGFIAQIFLTATLFASIATAAGSDGPDASSVTTGIVAAAIIAVVSLVVIGVIGWLTWWWMAHAFRERILVTGSDHGTHPRIQGIG